MSDELQHGPGRGQGGSGLGEKGRILNFEAILAGIVLGGTIGAILALRVQMTAMPEMVALLNGFGGGASVFVEPQPRLRRHPQPLFAADNTLMLFGDGKRALMELVAALKEG